MQTETQERPATPAETIKTIESAADAGLLSPRLTKLIAAARAAKTPAA